MKLMFGNRERIRKSELRQTEQEGRGVYSDSNNRYFDSHKIIYVSVMDRKKTMMVN